MIERLGSQIELHCDCGCGAVSGPPWRSDEFRAMIDDAKARGWTVKRDATIKGGWSHHAPNCDRQGSLI